MESLKLKLLKRDREGRLRGLKIQDTLVDFCSNDYLGLANAIVLKDRILSELRKSILPAGSTGSRLVTGHSLLFDEVEYFLADFHQAESALVFNSGYDANLGLFSSIAGRGDTILFDSLSHASIRDGIRLSYAKSFSFRHNDLSDLESKLKRARGNIFIAVESVYSMDGDIAPLVELCALAEKFAARLIVDEAHATGVFGNQGRGLVCDLDLHDRVFARIHTFGKAIGCHGAVVLGSGILREYLINFARSLIYSTALAPHSLVAIKKAYEFMIDYPELRKQLSENISFFQKHAQAIKGMRLQPGAIQILVCPGNDAVKEKAKRVAGNGLDVRAILSPTVPAGQERLRICLHAFNSKDELARLVESLKNLEDIPE